VQQRKKPRQRGFSNLQQEAACDSAWKLEDWSI